MIGSIRPWLCLALLSAAAMLVPDREAFALITGGEGNTPVADPGWPAGAESIFNSESRIAWWEGPPFGGGQWHAECRGEATALSKALAGFAKLDARSRRVVLRDGVGHSFWLDPNREPAKKIDARVDWVFMVWQAANWERLRKLPADLNPTDPADAEKGPPSEIDVYTGGNVRWSDVIVPPGLEIVDRRLEAHGFSAADGVVLEGKVVDLATKNPIAARMRLERIEPDPKGGYRYPVVTEVAADAEGHWVLKKTPEGWGRVVIEAEGYVPRVIGHVQVDEQPGWQSYDEGLSRPAPVSGQVLDDAGEPLADVNVQLRDLVSESGGRYETPRDLVPKTGADGRFRAEQVPAGRATIWVNKQGYCRPGLGQVIKTPKEDVELVLLKSASLRVTVECGGVEGLSNYLIRIVPEGGEAVGLWSASGTINALNQVAYENIPPGRYVVRGQPNPSSGDQRSQPVTIDLKGGQTTDVKLPAK